MDDFKDFLGGAREVQKGIESHQLGANTSKKVTPAQGEAIGFSFSVEADDVSPKPLVLDVVFADELLGNFVPPDEIVEGVITSGDGSILYGDSNSGKTFLVIDMACSIALGRTWLGMRTEPGLVIYLAAESPQSVQMRLQAYQKHYGVKVPNFAVVKNPIDLYSDIGDTRKIIELVKRIEAERNIKAVLIVGDTLARLSAGANENAGQDMGIVVKHFDLIRTECKSHFMLIHHCGKNTAAGARGWSGIRAAVDTEIEVTDSGIGRCIEITKQRDLSSKGVRIGFDLKPIQMGLSKWGKPVTSCYVTATDVGEGDTKKVKLSKRNECFLTALSDATDADGVPPTLEIKLKFGGFDSFEGRHRKVVRVDDWRKHAYKIIPVNSEKNKQDALKKAFGRAREYLFEGNYIAEYEGYVWRVF